MANYPLQVAPRDEDLYTCVHCGLCLNVCPTYLETGLETESPRGRIALMKAVREERVGLTGHVVPHMELCLQCRACEVACPSGVPFGRLMEATRAQIYERRKEPLVRRLALRVVFRHLLPYPGRLYLLGRLLCFYERTPLFGLFRRLPGLVGELQEQLPRLPSRFFQPRAEPFEPVGEVRARPRPVAAPSTSMGATVSRRGGWPGATSMPSSTPVSMPWWWPPRAAAPP